MRLLKRGGQGPPVQLLQLALNRAGYGPLALDGVFGQGTERALLRFQRALGLRPDGAAGRETHRALLPWYTGYAAVRLRHGDSLRSVSGRFGSSEAAVLTANPWLSPRELPFGARITVPLGFPVVPTNIAYCSELTAFCVRGLAARYPFLRAGEIGRSVLGRPLWSLTLGSGDNRVAYNGGHHANEWITVPLLLHFAEELAQACAGGRELFGVNAREILDYTTLCLIPAVNPDGMDLVTGALEDREALAAARAIAADHPQFPFPSGWKANIRGIDLNLQYPALWEQARENKRTAGIDSPAPADFPGFGPLSAPESRALYAFTLAFDPALTLAYHSQGEVLYWKFLDFMPPKSRDIGEAFAQASGYALEETPFASGFAGYKDWFIQDFDRPGYTVEVGLGQNPLPLTDFDLIYERNRGILTLGMLLT